MTRDLKEKLVAKQNLVRNGGKGKYDVTVPNEFDFMKHGNKHMGKTYRQEWLEED